MPSGIACKASQLFAHCVSGLDPRQLSWTGPMKQNHKQIQSTWHQHTIAGAVSAAVLAMGSPSPHAQDVFAGDFEALPEIVVEGTTIAVTKDVKPKEKSKQKKATSNSGQVNGTPSQATSPSGGGSGEVAGANDAGQFDPLVSEDYSGIETSQRVAGQLLQNQGTSVTVVTSEQLKAQQVRHAADALRSLPGVSVNRSGSFGGVTQVRLRGAEGNHTLVLIDGIQVNDTTNGEFDFSDLAAHDIEKIEVIRGAQSSLYGSAAIGGVINIVTRSGKGPVRVTVHGETGSFATRQGGASLSGGTDDIWGRISYLKRERGGYNIAPLGDEDDGSSLSNFSLSGGARLIKGVTLDLTLRRTKKSGERDTEGAVLGQLQQQTDDPATFDSDIWAKGARLTWETLGGAFTQVFSVNHLQTRRIDISPTSLFRTDTLGERYNYRYAGTLKFVTPGAANISHTITGLVDREEERFTPNSVSSDPFFGFADDGIARVRKRWAFAGEWRVDVADQLFLSASIRRDDNSTFEDFTTWRTTATWKVLETGLRFHGSVGTAVKAPTMFDQFGTIPLFFTPNPNIIHEQSFGWDAGIEWASRDQKYVLDVTYFKSDLENQIDGFAPGPNFTFTSVNRLGISHRKGIEVTARAPLLAGLSLAASYTYLDATTPDGLQEVRRPRHAGRADLHYVGMNDKLNVNLSVIYNGEMVDPVRRVTAFNFGFPALQPERFTLEAYWLVNVAASYQVQPGIELYGRVENALDQEYQEIFGFEAPPVAAFAGVRFTYGEE